MNRIEPLEAYADGAAGVIDLRTLEGQALSSGRVRVEVFVQAEGVGILEAAEHFVGRLVEHGPELDGWLVEPMSDGIHHQLTLRFVEPTSSNRYDSLDELLAAVTAAGLPCTAWSVVDDVPDVEVGACAEGTRFFVHHTDEGHARSLLALEDYVRKQVAVGDDPDPILVGDNWIVVGANAELLVEALDGTLM